LVSSSRGSRTACKSAPFLVAVSRSFGEGEDHFSR
jgi:hypothetical protein